jgi:phage baseplate assembly protein W
MSKKFSDLDLNLTPHPVSGDIIPLKDSDAIKRSLKNLLLTEKYERPFNPKLGANLNSLLFEPVSILSELNIKLLIQDIIRIYEPRITLLNINVISSVEENGYNITIYFVINDISETVTFDFFLERLR